MEGCAEFSKEFEEFNESARGEYGMAAQYWSIYLDLMRNQTAVQENDLERNRRKLSWPQRAIKTKLPLRASSKLLSTLDSNRLTG